MIDCGSDPTTDLVLAAQQGSRSALDMLFVRYLPRVRQIVALRLGRPVRDIYAYEDIVQDALLNVFMRLRSFDAASEWRFRNWAATCVTNSVREHFRRARAGKRGGDLPSYPYESQDLLATVVAGEDADPVKLAELAEFSERIEAALLSLPQTQRELIIKARLCGMSAAAIAGDADPVKMARIRKQLSRALRRLARELGL